MRDEPPKLPFEVDEPTDEPTKPTDKPTPIEPTPDCECGCCEDCGECGFCEVCDPPCGCGYCENCEEKSLDFQVIDYSRVFGYIGERVHFEGQTRIVRSLTELYPVIDYFEKETLYSGNPLDSLPSIEENFFEDNALVVVYYYIGSGTPRVIFDSIVRKNNTLVINSTYGAPVGSIHFTQDIAVWRIILAVDHNDLEGIKTIKYGTSKTMDFLDTECIHITSGDMPHWHETFPCYSRDNFEKWLYGWLESKKYFERVWDK
jgi:hypothetical protein